MKQDIRPQQPMPPRPWPEGEIRRNIKLGEVKVKCKKLSLSQSDGIKCRGVRPFVASLSLFYAKVAITQENF